MTDTAYARSFAPHGAALADRYRIERKLSAGGMATVYLARDPKHDPARPPNLRRMTEYARHEGGKIRFR